MLNTSALCESISASSDEDIPDTPCNIIKTSVKCWTKVKACSQRPPVAGKVSVQCTPQKLESDNLNAEVEHWQLNLATGWNADDFGSSNMDSIAASYHPVNGPQSCKVGQESEAAKFERLNSKRQGDNCSSQNTDLNQLVAENVGEQFDIPQTANQTTSKIFSGTRAEMASINAACHSRATSHSKKKSSASMCVSNLEEEEIDSSLKFMSAADYAKQPQELIFSRCESTAIETIDSHGKLLPCTSSIKPRENICLASKAYKNPTGILSSSDSEFETQLSRGSMCQLNPSAKRRKHRKVSSIKYFTSSDEEGASRRKLKPHLRKRSNSPSVLDDVVNDFDSEVSMQQLQQSHQLMCSTDRLAAAAGDSKAVTRPENSSNGTANYTVVKPKKFIFQKRQKGTDVVSGDGGPSSTAEKLNDRVPSAGRETLPARGRSVLDEMFEQDSENEIFEKELSEGAGRKVPVIQQSRSVVVAQPTAVDCDHPSTFMASDSAGIATESRSLTEIHARKCHKAKGSFSLNDDDFVFTRFSSDNSAGQSAVEMDVSQCMDKNASSVVTESGESSRHKPVSERKKSDPSRLHKSKYLLGLDGDLSADRVADSLAGGSVGNHNKYQRDSKHCSGGGAAVSGQKKYRKMKTCGEDGGDIFNQLSVACVRDSVLASKDDHVIDLSSPNASSLEWESVLDGFFGIPEKDKPGAALKSRSRLSPTRRFLVQEASGERKLNSAGGSRGGSELAYNLVNDKSNKSRLQASGKAHHLRLRPGSIDGSTNNEKLDEEETGRAYIGRHNPFKVNRKTGHEFRNNESSNKPKPSEVKGNGAALAAGRPAVVSRDRSLDAGHGRKVTISGGSRCGQFDLLDRIDRNMSSSTRKPLPALEVGASSAVECAQTTVEGGGLKLGRKTQQQRRRLRSEESSEDETTAQRRATAKRKHLTAAVINVDEGESSDEAKTNNSRGTHTAKGKKKAKPAARATVIEKSNTDIQLPGTEHAADVAVLPPFHRRQRSQARNSSVLLSPPAMVCPGFTSALTLLSPNGGSLHNDVKIIGEVTGHDNQQIMEAINACRDIRGNYDVTTVINHLFGDSIPAPPSNLGQVDVSGFATSSGPARSNVLESDPTANSMIQFRINQLSDYEWSVHMALHNGTDVPQPPAGYHGPSPDSFVDPDILSHLFHCREHGLPEPQRLLPSSWRNTLAAISHSFDNPAISGSSAESSDAANNGTNDASSTNRPSRSSQHRSPSLFRRRHHHHHTGDLSRRLPGDSSVNDLHVPPRVRPRNSTRANVVDLVGRSRLRSPVSPPMFFGHDFFFEMFGRHFDEEGGDYEPSFRSRLERSRTRSRGFNGRFREEFADNELAFEDLLDMIERIGDARPRGLDTNVIQQLPTKIFSMADVKDGDTVPECNICLCDYTDGDRLRILQCLHKFHTTCIDKWLKESRSCPICRVEVQL